ncbi:hypothetical protein EGJ55_18165 [Pseudomonas moraviensis]|nr:hypothetical protein EGJ55_18165 [Pseudomonas moraviensis]
MGASLLAKRPVHSASMSSDWPLSRAGSLPPGAVLLCRIVFYTFSGRPLHGESASCLLRSNV